MLLVDLGLAYVQQLVPTHLSIDPSLSDAIYGDIDHLLSYVPVLTSLWLLEFFMYNCQGSCDWNKLSRGFSVAVPMRAPPAQTTLQWHHTIAIMSCRSDVDIAM